MTRNSRKVLLLASVFGLSLLSCGREVTGPENGLHFGRNRVAALAIDPRFQQLPGANLASDLVPFVKVRVTLRRTDGTIEKDTVVDFPSTADSVALALDIPLPLTAADSGLPLTLAMAFVNAAGDTVFRGGPVAITAKPSGAAGANPPITIPVSWVPPGVTPASVVMTPDTGSVVAGTTTVFTATAFSAGGAPIAGTPIGFTSTDTSRATVAALVNGSVTWRQKRGVARIVATLPNGPADTSVFNVSLPASRLLVVSGGTQSALIGTALAQPLAFRVTATDSVPVAGIPVTFAVTTGGGTLVAAADTSDATGLVTTSWTLGPLVGAQSVTATATGIAGATQVVTATGLPPTPTQLAITAAPTTGVAGATLSAVTVAVRDAGNALTPLFTGPVTLALNAGATGATLAGTTTVNAVAGIATFADLSIQKAAGGLTFTATSGALTPATSAALAILPAAPAALVALAGDAQTGTLGQPLVDSLDVQLRDAFANPISGSTITFGVVTGGGSVAPTSVVTDANGRARAGWTLGSLVGAQTARAELSGMPAIFVALSATGVPGTPVRLVITAEPNATQVAGSTIAPAITVRAVDAVGATATSFAGNVALALAANPTAATPSGTLSTAAVAGIATFSNVSILKAGAGYTFEATSGALTSDTTVAFAVLNAGAAQLTTVSGDGQSGTVGAALALPMVVRVLDAFGNGVAGYAVNWSVTAGSGTLGAAATTTDANGDASNTLTLANIAGGVSVSATAGGVTGSPQVFTSTAVAGSATQLAFTLNTGGGVAGLPVTPGWTIHARDAAGNLVAGFTGPITVALSNGPVAATLGGTTTVNAVGGVANFGDLTVDLTNSSWVLLASSPGLTGAASAAFSISPAAPAAIVVSAGDAQTGAVQGALGAPVTFRVTDAFGNPTNGTAVSVAITAGAGSVAPTSGVTNVAGEFSTTWTLGSTPGAQSITASVTATPALQTIASATATPGAAVSLALVAPMTTPVVAGDTLPDVIVEARDAAGNVATSFIGVVSGRVITGPNGPDPDSIPVTAIAGVATFSGATFDRAGDYVILFNAVGLTDVLSNTVTVTVAAAYAMNGLSGGGQTGTVGQSLPAPMVVAVEDRFFNRIPGVSVQWTMTRNLGADTIAVATVATDASGVSAYQPTLPTLPGTVQMTARSTGLLGSPMVFAANIDAGAPASLAVAEGDGQTGPASLQLPTPLGARITDAFGNAIGGVTVNWTVQSGGGTLAPASSVTGADGVARTIWGMGGSIGSQSVNASASGLTDVTFTATATATTANVVWTGATSSLWSVASNWSGGAVPTASDSVHIPAGTPFATVLDVQTAVVARLQVDNGVTLVLDTFPLFVNGTLDVQTGAAVLSDSIGGFALIGNGTVRGAMPRLYVQAGTHALAGALAVAGDLSVAAGSFDIGTFAATVGGTFATIGSGLLVMTNAPGSLTVQGDALFSGASTVGQLTAGTLTVRGDFSQGAGAPDAFSASGSHVVELDGTAAQAVTLINADASLNAGCVTSCFATLRSLRGAGTGTLSFSTDAKALVQLQVTGDTLFAPGQTLIAAGTPDLSSTVVIAGAVGWQGALVRSADFQVDSLIAWGSGALIAGEVIPTRVAGTYTVTGTHPAGVVVDGAFATLDVAGNATIGTGVGDGLVTRGNGRLIMQQNGDTLVVNGNADFGGVTVAGLMTDGVLQVSGNLVQTGAALRTLWAEGTHVTRMSGNNIAVTFAGATNNQLNAVTFDGVSAVTLNGDGHFAGNVVVGPSVSVIGGSGTIRLGGDLVETVGNRWQAQFTQFDGVDPQLPASMISNVDFKQGVTLDGPLTVSGALTVSGGTLDVTGRKLDVSGTFGTTGAGVLRMATSADTVIVGGAASFNGGSTAGQMNAGYLELLGSLTQSTNAEAFAPSGTHQTWFRGNTAQSVSFTNPGLGAGNSHFAALGVAQNGIGVTVQLNTDAVADGMILTEPALSRRFSAPTSQLLTSRGAIVTGLVFQNVRWSLADGAPVPAIDSLSFVAQDPSVVQFAITRAAGTVNMSNLGFTVTPTSGQYLRVEDPDGATGGSLVVNITSPSPATNGGYLQVIAPAVVNGWPNTPAFIWTGGAATSNWTTGTNWSGGVVPGPADSVLIPNGTAVKPSIPGGVTLRALVSQEALVALQVTGAVTITERLVVPTSSGLTCAPGSINFSNAVTPMTAAGNLDCFVRVLDGTLTATDTLHVANNDLQVEGTSTLDVGGDLVTVDFNFSTMATARLRMQNAAAHLHVGGGATFGGGSTAGLLTAGLLEVGGNFTQNNDPESFSAGPNQTTRFIGSAVQQVTFNNSSPAAGNSHFGRIELSQTGAGVSVQTNNDLFALGALGTGPGPVRLFTSGAGPLTIQSAGADVRSIGFDNVRWVVRDGAPITQMDTVSFSNMDPTVTQLDIERTADTVNVVAPTFNTVPGTGGVYLRVADADAGGTSVFGVNVANATPSFSSSKVTVVPPAVLLGWPQNPSFVWTGAVDTQWGNAANWGAGLVPAATDSVTIPAAATNAPSFSANDTVRVLVNNSAFGVQVPVVTLTVTEKLIGGFASPVVACVSTGSLVLAPSAGGAVNGRIDCPLSIESGTVVPVDSVRVNNNLSVSGNGRFTLGGRTARVLGAFSTAGSGTLQMTQASDLLDVAFAATFGGGSTTGLLTAGVMRVGRAFDQSGSPTSFDAGPGHRTILRDDCAGSCGALAVTVSNPSTTNFGTLEFTEGARSILSALRVTGDLIFSTPGSITGTGGFTVEGNMIDTMTYGVPPTLDVNTLQVNLVLDYKGVYAVDTTLFDGTGAIPARMGGVRVPYGVVVVNGTRVTQMAIGDTLAIAGDLTLNIGRLRVGAPDAVTAVQVGGRMRLLQGTARLQMTDTATVLQVATGADFQAGSTAPGFLTEGTLRLGADLTVAAGGLYQPSGAHRTVLYNGCALCDGLKVQFADTLSFFDQLDLESGNWSVLPASADVHIAGNLNFIGAAQLDGTPLVRVGNNVNGNVGTLANSHLSVTGAFDFAGSFLTDTLILSGANHVLTARDPGGAPRAYASVRVTGTATVIDDPIDVAQVLVKLIVDGGELRVGSILSTDSARVQVNGWLETINGGRLAMVTDWGRMQVGNALFAGGSTDGLLTAGTLAVSGGDFFQSGDPASFAASGTHLTRFSNEGLQDITFANPGASAVNSHFRHLQIQQTLSSGLNLLSDVVATGQLRESMSQLAEVRAPVGAAPSLTTGGASVDGILFTNARWVLGAGAPVDSTRAIGFGAMPDNVTQLTIVRPNGTVALDNLSFTTLPSTGLYLRVDDGAPADNDTLKVVVSNPIPTVNNGLVQSVNGAQLTGWPASIPLQGIVWTGAADNQWSNTANWDLARLPVATDSVYINGVGNPYTVNIDAGVTAAKLIVGPSGTLTLNHTFAQTLQVDGLFAMPSNVTFNVTSGSVVTGAGNIQSGGFLNLNGGTLAGTGGTVVQAGGTANIATTDNVTLNARTLSIGGTATVGAFVVSDIGSPKLETLVGGELDFTAPNSFFQSGSSTIVNAGTLRVGAAGNTVRIDWPITNTGTLEVQNGLLDLRGLLTVSAGRARVLNTASLELSSSVFGDSLVIADGGQATLMNSVHGFNAGSSVTGGGRFNVNSGAAVTIQGKFDVDSMFLANATLDFNGTDTAFVSNGDYLTGGALRGTGIFAIRNLFTTGPNTNGTGTIAVLPSATVTLGDNLRGWTLDVLGTAVWGDKDLTLEVDPIGLVKMAEITVQNGGVFNIQHPTGDWQLFGDAAQIMVAGGGTIRKSLGTGVSTIKQVITMLTGGVFDVQTGTIDVQNLTCNMSGIKTGAGSLTGVCGNFP